jgi:hypothetical protein
VLELNIYYEEFLTDESKRYWEKSIDVKHIQ